MNKKLLVKYIEGNVTEDEIIRVVQWLDADEAHVREYMSLQKVYNISLFNPLTRLTNGKWTNKKRIIRRIITELLKVAAIAGLVIGICLFLKNSEEMPEGVIAYQSFYAPAGQRAEVILPDDTRVWLNAKSRLTYPSNFRDGRREIILEGEAYFDVVHRGKRPFIVKTDRVEVEVYGTEFNICDYGDMKNPEVALLKGSIAINTSFLPQKYEMSPHHKVRIEEGKLHVSPISEYDYFKWKEGLLCFFYEPVGLIMKKLERHFDIKIDVHRESLLNYRYTGKFRVDDGVEQVFKVLQHEHKFNYIRDTENNVIIIK